MFELLTIVLFIWLLSKAIGMVLMLAWGMAKIVAGILIVIALPALILCLLFAGGIALLLPIVLIGAAVGITKACVNV